MRHPALPPRDAVSGAILVALLVTAVYAAAPGPGPGPYALVLGVALAHAAVLAPALGASAWPAVLALPALGATVYGHPGAWPLLGGAALLAAAAAAGAFGRGPLYLALAVLLFALPFALNYLRLEFGGATEDAAWLAVSPAAAAARVAAGEGPSPGALLGMLAVAAVVRRRPR